MIDPGPTDARGYLEAPAAGEVVLSVPSPEALAREADEVRRVIVGAARASSRWWWWWRPPEELRDDELAPLLEAASRTSRGVILRIMADV